MSAILLASLFGVVSAQTAVQTSRQIDISAYVLGKDDLELDNGEYSVRFAIYSRDRQSVDPYPSNSDQKIWEETQEVEINKGILNAYLGAVKSLPESLDFSSNNYYLGIRIGTDSEMVPRKKIAAIPLAINAFSLQGAIPGTKEGNILQLGKGGVIEESILPEITTLGTVDAGAWEADPITSEFIDTALSGKTYDGLTLTANTDGFSIAGGSTSRKLTLTGGDVTLNVPGAAGSIAFSNGTGYSFSAAGTAGQVLISGGSGAPTWGAASGGVETDPIFGASSAAAIVAGDIVNWNTAFGWGDHSVAGYITDGNTGWDNSYGFVTDLSTFTTDNLTQGSTNLYSQWITAGSDIYYTAGNVGIGTSADASYLVNSAIGTWKFDTGTATDTNYGTFDTNNQMVLKLYDDSNNELSYIGLWNNELWMKGRNAADVGTELGLTAHSPTDGFFRLTTAVPADGSGAVIGSNIYSDFSLLATATDSYTAFKLNVADTADPDVTSKVLMDLQTNSVSQFVVTAGGSVGIGDTAPDNLLEILSSGAANTQLTVSNTNAGDYNPQIGFELADGTNLFTMGVDDSDSDKFKIYSGTSITGTSEFSIDSTGLVSIGNLEMGAQVFADDAGAVSWIDMGVTSGAVIGTVESYTAQLDGNPLLTIYGESDGAGGIQNTRMGFRVTSPLATLHLDGTDTKLRIEDDNLPQLDFYDDNVYEAFINTNGADMYVKSATGSLYLGTLNSATDFRILGASGNVGIGISPTARLHLGGVAGTVSFEINSNETTAASNVIAVRSDVASADDLIFRVQADGAVFADGAYTGTGADYAEYFETADTDLQSGETVCLDPEKENAVKRCVRSGDNDIMGIISSRPSIVGNNRDNRKNDPNYKIVAMLGQTPGQVSTENGTIQIGDSLTSSIFPGYLRKADPGESTVGVALQNFSQDKGTVQVLISRKNKSLTVEKVEEAVSLRIAEMDVQDQVDSLITSARTELDTAMLTLSSGVDAKILNLTAIIEAQINEIRADNQANLNLILQNSTDINALTAQVKSILSDDPGSLASRVKNLEVLNRLSSRNLANGGLEIIMVDPEALTIGEDAILENENVKFVETKAATAEAKIYITPIGSTDNQVIYVGDITDQEGFEVKVDRLETIIVPNEIRFNWWIVESR